MIVSHLEIRRVDTGMHRCKTHGLSRVNFLFFFLFVKGGVDFRAVEVV